MRLKIIQQLVNVNIIYASQPAQIAKLRAKQAKNRTSNSMLPVNQCSTTSFRIGLFPHIWLAL
ncbi:hypothetical protein SD436_07490 [Streptococcus sp. 2A/TPW/M5]